MPSPTFAHSSIICSECLDYISKKSTANATALIVSIKHQHPLLMEALKADGDVVTGRRLAHTAFFADKAYRDCHVALQSFNYRTNSCCGPPARAA
jgi:hypothetical protein